MPSKSPLIEDHAGTRDALVASLGDFSYRISVVGAFADAASFLSAQKVNPVDVALVDLRLPGMSGNELIRALSEQPEPKIRVIALSAFADDQSVFEALRAGAHGYQLKDEPPERLVRAVEEAASGAHPLSSRITGFLVSQARHIPAPVALSNREEELAVALAEGLTYAECSERMGIAIGTVQHYVKRVYRKLDVSSKREVREWVKRYSGR
ncbi:MAG: response regulator transcription factor [Myxococcaceae bacterium]